MAPWNISRIMTQQRRKQTPGRIAPHGSRHWQKTARP
nr:MAG TPA: hypothetical protein [Caudoviricetes sp.]